MALLPHPLVVVVHDVRSAYNVGAVFRTADSAGLARVVLTGYTPTPAHRGVAKTALGAEGAVPWERYDTAEDAFAALRAEGFAVAALERTPEAVAPGDVPASAFPLALVLGNEKTGVPRYVLDAADLVVGLPQYGAKASLNVAVAFGAAAYRLVERYQEVGRGEGGPPERAASR
ncbi:TrmH family RNA methyltransferase [Rubrivirga sp. S365]|uniref:TrmH family RNA methyltransferase n=1 Tax=Rubrivirga sp. S365 TaxID=3076080 RepID=UPI0028C7245F|nr:TrmH family RNA methyltransferase [Rubrivirga sp. S365]MDT7857302.1 TrmH family RNA methyltransferase [Rubrivirga sp. S365]